MIDIEGNPHAEKAAKLRTQVLESLPFIETLEEEERLEFGADYWETAVRLRIAMRDYEGAFHRIQVALLGAKAFEGPDGICRGHVDGEPVGLFCSTDVAIGLVNLLYRAMRDANLLTSIASVPLPEKAWGPLFPRGQHIARAIGYEANCLRFITGLEAIAIAEYLSRRRISVH